MAERKRTHGPSQLYYHAALCIPAGSKFSVTAGARDPEDVDRNVEQNLPVVKRACLELQAAVAEMEEHQRVHGPGGKFVCEKCAAEFPTANLMYPVGKNYNYDQHQCIRWPRWCDTCVSTYQPTRCPGEGCGVAVEWTGGQKFFVHVSVKEVGTRDWCHKMSFTWYVDPDVATLRTLKATVLEKANVPVADQRYSLKGVDKTLRELGLAQGATVSVHYVEKA